MATALETTATTGAVQVRINPPTRELTVTVPKGVSGEKRVSVADRTGLVWAEGAFDGAAYTLSTADMPAGAYILRVTGATGLIEERKILIRP